jgi:hypothetical protein
VPVALAVALLVSWRAGIPNRQDEAYGELLRASHLGPGIITRIALYGPLMLGQMFRFHHWANFWIMVPAVLLAGWRALRHPRAWRWALAAAGPAVVACAAYTVSTEPRMLAAVTWERFLLHGALPSFMLLAAAAAEVARHFLARRGLSRRQGRREPEGPPPPGAAYGGKAELSSPPQ